MVVVFGTNSKGKPTVICRNFGYVKERDNHCGTTYIHTFIEYARRHGVARSIKNSKYAVESSLDHLSDRIVSNRQP